MPDIETNKNNLALTASDYLRKILLSPVYEVAVVSPLQPMRKLSERTGNSILLKREDRQPVHSFKIRGAFNKLVQLSEAQKLRGVVAASAGNHAQGVALSAKKLEIKAIIVMPVITPAIKVDAVRSFGAEVCLHGESFDEASKHAIKLSEEQGYTLIHPFDDEDVIAGQGTVARELLEQNAHLNYIFVPVGGGGLAAGIAVYIKQLRPDIKVIGVEPRDSACLRAALNAGEPVTLDRVGIFADGVAVKRIGSETFRLCHQYIDDVITVSSDEICASLKDIFEDTRAIAEPSGALALAGLKKYTELHQISDTNMAAVLSGANVNFHSLRYVSERSEYGEKKEAVLAVTIPERRGAFLKFCQLIGNRAVTEFNYRYSTRAEANIFVGLRTPNGVTEVEQVIQQLSDEAYPVVDLSEDEMAKQHVRYMVGGRPAEAITERLFSFEFPEHPGALQNFLLTLGMKWNITLFHYRNHGAAYGRVLAGFELPDEEMAAFGDYLKKLGYQHKEETNNPAYKFFLAH